MPKVLHLDDLFSFFDIEPEIVSKPGAAPVPRPIARGFAFENVGFRYPDAERWALRQLDFELRAGEEKTIGYAIAVDHSRRGSEKLLKKWLDAGAMAKALRASGPVRAVFSDLVAGTQPYRGLRRRLLATGEWRLAARTIRLTLPPFAGTMKSVVSPQAT